MGYIIKNITNKLDKRHPFANTNVDFSFEKKNFTTNIISLNVGKEIVLDGELPISVHNLRIKGFITIKKISDNELNAFIKKIANEEKNKNREIANIIVDTSKSEVKEEKTKTDSSLSKKKKSFSNN